ncbi:MAG: protein kinase [Gemmatimonadota bacterium]
MLDVMTSLQSALADRYRLERELGSGGMATVYLAQDLKHDRKVAIKVLRPELAVVIGAERFLREIKTIATLQHPHILGLIDSGEVNGTAYYVMPFVEGESLRDRLNREKQLPINDAVRLATEVAAALDYAHRHGVIHRDIKPENIMLHDGSALVADFGIALAISSAGGGKRMTETGMSLGTPHYMSPEQAMGEREITARSDVYALGAMTYEMLIGEPPFTGPTAQAIIAKVMTSEPAGLIAQRRSIAPAIEDAVLTALEKLPADRFASAAEFAAALTGAPTATRTAIRTTSARRGVRGWRALAIVGGVTFCLGALGTWLFTRVSIPPVPPPVLRYAIPLTDSTAVMEGGGGSFAYAADGSVFAFTSRSGLMLRYADRLELVPVPGGRRATSPFFSPDHRWVAYLDGARLMKVPLAGGAPATICDPCTGYTYSWGSDDTVRYHTAPASNLNGRVLMAVSVLGGTPYEFARPDSGTNDAFRQPILLPGTRTVLFSYFTGSSSRLGALDLRTHAITRFDQPGFSPQWVDAGFVVLGSGDGSLVALPFDPDKVRPTGPPMTIARDVAQPDGYSSRASVSAGGAIIYRQFTGDTPRQLLMVGRSGQATHIPGEARPFAGPRFSPDGRRMAVGITNTGAASRDIWVLDIAQRTWSRLTTDGISDRPIWTPDGRRLVYSSNDDLWWVAADGSGRPDSLLVANGSRFAGTVTPDGRAVVFEESGSVREGIRTLVFDSAPASREIIPGRFGESAPVLSPDGKWLAYQSDETGQMEVYVRPYPGPGARISVSLHGGTEPVWSHSGRELFFRAGDSLMVAAVSLTPTIVVTGQRLLFTGPFLTGVNDRQFDVSPDDQHFIMLSGGTGPSTLIGLQNVFARRRFDEAAPR